MIPSSLTPPPSSQIPALNPVAAGAGYAPLHRSNLFSPPTTGGAVRREVSPVSDYLLPAPEDVRGASADTLRALMQGAITEILRLQSETAHYRLQMRLSALQQDEDARRAAIEYDMTRREVEALREVDHARQARRELSEAAESSRSRYLEVKGLFEDALEEIDSLNRQLRVAKKVIRDQGDEISVLKEDRQQLRTRIRENRERFNMLRSPGGILHSLLSPKQPGVSTPQQPSRGTPKQARSGGRRASKSERNHEHKFEALLQALSQENNSAPSTPMPSLRPPPRTQSKHTRNVQSLSSLPTTPTSRVRNDGHLLPSAQLIPQTEPVHRFGHRRYLPDSRPRGDEDPGRRSRESTISVPETDPNAELARKALASVESLNSVKKASTSLTMAAAGAPLPRRIGEEDEEEELPQSQASVAASEMLRRDPRESFDVASSADSRDVTPAPDPRTQALLSNMARQGEKRKFSGTGDARRELTSPPKKVRMGGPEPGKVGLGINY